MVKSRAQRQALLDITGKAENGPRRGGRLVKGLVAKFEGRKNFDDAAAFEEEENVVDVVDENQQARKRKAAAQCVPFVVKKKKPTTLSVWDDDEDDDAENCALVATKEKKKKTKDYELETDLLATFLEREVALGSYCAWAGERVVFRREKAVARIFAAANRSHYSKHAAHLAVALMDRYATTQCAFQGSCDEASSLAAFFLAVKFHENSVDAPPVRRLATETTTTARILQEEGAILRAIDYDLRLPTVLGFLDLAASLLFGGVSSSFSAGVKTLSSLSRFLADFAVAAADFLSVKPSDLALVCLALGEEPALVVSSALLGPFGAHSPSQLLFPAVALSRSVKRAFDDPHATLAFLFDDAPILSWDDAFATMKRNLRDLHRLL